MSTNECGAPTPDFATPLNTPGMGSTAGVDPLVLPKRKRKIKSLRRYIDELNEGAKPVNALDSKRNTPDYVHYRGSHNYWNDSSARGFIFNKETKQLVWTEPGRGHDEIFEFDEEGCKRIGLEGVNINQIKFLDWENYSKKDLPDAIENWYEHNKEYIDKFLLGRVWYVDPNAESADSALMKMLGMISDEPKKKSRAKTKTFISWWSELTSKEFNEFNKIVLDNYCEENDVDIDNYYAVDNNGKIIKMNLKHDMELNIDARSEESKKDVEAAEAIHLASQEEKKEYFRFWKDKINKAKDEELQMLGWKDSDRCYAKRNNMFTKHTVLDPATGKYKVVYGAKLGDSLEDICTQVIVESGDFFKKHGIKEVECGLGFSEEEQKWYGWSHRAIYGWTIGDKIYKGACGYSEMMKVCPDGKIKTLEDAKKIAKIFADAVS